MFCALLMLAKISGERLQDHWSSGFLILGRLQQSFLASENLGLLR